MIDQYLQHASALKRLLNEYNTHNSLVVAYDFDNTVYDFHGTGENYDMVIDLLNEAKSIGCYMICFTANSNYEFVSKYLKDNNIPFDSINENPPFFKGKERKIYYNVLLDDRAGLIQAYTELNQLVKSIKSKTL